MTDVNLYPIADAIQVPLHVSRNVAKGHAQKTMRIGPWELKCDIIAETDFFDAADASAIVKLRKNLWAYVWYEKASSQTLFCLFKKPDRLKTMEIASFVAGKQEADDYMVEIRANLIAVFSSVKRSKWTCVEPSVLDERLARQGFKLPAAGLDLGDDSQIGF